MSTVGPNTHTSDKRIVAPAKEPRCVRTQDGQILRAPSDWMLLPPGDAALTRRVKAAGPSWTVQEKRGNKTFSLGVWVPSKHVEEIRAELQRERSTETYAKAQARNLQRRVNEQANYVEDFQSEVQKYLRFAPRFASLGVWMARAITAHATPVGSGTVARTKRIPIERRAESAVIAWMRHQTTAYDHMKIERVRGARREVRRELATVSRSLLEHHRVDRPHPATVCPLCCAFQNAT